MGDEAEVVSDWNDDTAFFDSWSDECGNFMYKEYHDTKRFMAGLHRDASISKYRERLRKQRRKLVRKKEERYIENKQAKVGTELRCPGHGCGNTFVKKSYQQAFCCTKCKDAFWNKRTEFYGYRKQVDIPKEEDATTEQETLITTNTNHIMEKCSWDYMGARETLGLDEKEYEIVKRLSYYNETLSKDALKSARLVADELYNQGRRERVEDAEAFRRVLEFVTTTEQVIPAEISRTLVTLVQKDYDNVVKHLDILIGENEAEDDGSDYDKEFWGDESPKTESPFEGKVVLFPPIDIVKKTAPSFEGEKETLPPSKEERFTRLPLDEQLRCVFGFYGYVRCPDEDNRIAFYFTRIGSRYILKSISKTNNISVVAESEGFPALVEKCLSSVISPRINFSTISVKDKTLGTKLLESKVVAEVDGEEVDIATFVNLDDVNCVADSTIFYSKLYMEIRSILLGEKESKAFAKQIELIKNPDGSPLSNSLLRLIPTCTIANFFDPTSGELIAYVRRIDKSTWICVNKENFGDEGVCTKHNTEEAAISHFIKPLADKVYPLLEGLKSGYLLAEDYCEYYSVSLNGRTDFKVSYNICSTYNDYLAYRVLYKLSEYMESEYNLTFPCCNKYQPRVKASAIKLAYVRNDIYPSLPENLVLERRLMENDEVNTWYEFCEVVGNKVELACDYEDEKSTMRNIAEEVDTFVHVAVERNLVVPELFASMSVGEGTLEEKVFMKDKKTGKYYDLVHFYGEKSISHAQAICSELDKKFNMSYAMNNEEKKEVSLEEETIQEPLESEIDEDFLTDEDFSDEAIFGENFSCEHLSGKIAYIYIPVRNKKGGIGISVYKDEENAFSDCHVVVGGQTYDHRLCHIAIESAVDMLFQEVAKNRSDINLDAPIKMNYEKGLKAYYITINTNGEDIDIACARGHYEAEQILGALRFIQEYLRNTNHAGEYANTPKRMPYYNIAYDKDNKVGSSNTRTYRLTDYDVVRVRGLNDCHIVVSPSGEGEEDYVIPFNNLDTALVSLSFAVANKIAVHHTLVGEISISVMEDGGCDEYNVIVNGVGFETASFKEKGHAVKFAKELYKRLKEKFSN